MRPSPTLLGLPVESACVQVCAKACVTSCPQTEVSSAGKVRRQAHELAGEESKSGGRKREVGNSEGVISTAQSRSSSGLLLLFFLSPLSVEMRQNTMRAFKQIPAQ